MIAKRAEGSTKSRELIEKFSETLEKDLLKQFDRAYRKQQWDAMKVGRVGWGYVAGYGADCVRDRVVRRFCMILMGGRASRRFL